MIGSEKFGDYREQFVSPDEYSAGVADYCRQAGLPMENDRLLEQLRERLKTTAREVDQSFPENEALRIEHGEPVLQKLRRLPEPDQLRQIERLMSELIPEIRTSRACESSTTVCNRSRLRLIRGGFVGTGTTPA